MTVESHKKKDAVKLYNANDGLSGRDGGPYLDLEEARQAEKRRAFVEDREPDYDTMSLGAGVRLVNANQLIQVEGVTNTPSQSENPATESINKAVDNLETVKSVAEQPPEAVEEPEPADLSAVSFLAGEYGAKEKSDKPSASSTSSTSSSVKSKSS